MSKLKTSLNETKGELIVLVLKEVKKLIGFTKKDADQFIRRQGEKLEIYSRQLKEGLITKEQFDGYVIDVKILTEMQKDKLATAAQVTAGRLIEGILELVIKGLIIALTAA